MVRNYQLPQTNGEIVLFLTFPLDPLPRHFPNRQIRRGGQVRSPLALEHPHIILSRSHQHQCHRLPAEQPTPPPHNSFRHLSRATTMKSLVMWSEDRFTLARLCGCSLASREAIRHLMPLLRWLHPLLQAPQLALYHCLGGHRWRALLRLLRSRSSRTNSMLPAAV